MPRAGSSEAGADAFVLFARSEILPSVKVDTSEKPFLVSSVLLCTHGITGGPRLSTITESQGAATTSREISL